MTTEHKPHSELARIVFYDGILSDEPGERRKAGADALNELVEQKESYEKALKAIAFNARSFHKGEDGKERALDVIASWAENPDLVPEGVGYPARTPDDQAWVDAAAAAWTDPAPALEHPEGVRESGAGAEERSPASEPEDLTALRERWDKARLDSASELPRVDRIRGEIEYTTLTGIATRIRDLEDELETAREERDLFYARLQESRTQQGLPVAAKERES